MISFLFKNAIKYKVQVADICGYHEINQRNRPNATRKGAPTSHRYIYPEYKRKEKKILSC